MNANPTKPSKLSRAWSMIIDTYDRFSEYGDMLSAGTSFFALLSLAPLLMVAIGIAGLVFDRDQARATILSGLQRFASPEVIKTVTRLLESAEQQDAKIATVVAVILLMWAASRFFVQIQDALNTIWGVRPKQTTSVMQSLRSVALKRVLSLAMVVGCGALLLLMLILQTVLSVLSRVAEDLTGGLVTFVRENPTALMLQQAMVSLVLLTFLFGMIYRVLPDARVRWGDVWVGAGLTALLTLAGTWLLGMFLTNISPTWLQGALGSAAAFVLWTYYAAQVFYLGAAFTREWACRDGAHVQPALHAQLIDTKSS